MAISIGYTNASWTLKADLVAQYTTRLLAHMRDRGFRSVVPVREEHVREQPFMDFSSGYVLRALDQLPTQGDREPWRLRQSWFYDRRVLRRGDLEDGVLQFR
jgi:monooxygenase